MQQERVLGGRYVLERLLGRGGMAEVHLAQDTRLDRPVAVKVMGPGMADDPTYLARFRREAQSTASLNHPAVVAVFDSGEDTVDGALLPYLVMEYIHGTTLLDLLRLGQGQQGTAGQPPATGLPVRRALELTHTVLDGLAHAHAQGIIHRDIKPANVMVTEDGAVKLMDFGIARPVQDRGMTLTDPAMVIGTADYLSPEAARGESVDARADLYSVACLLFELLTGRPPFVGESALAVGWQQISAEPQPPSAFAPAVPRSCDGLVLRALAKDRESRFADAAAMRTAVEQELRQLDAASAATGTVGGPAVTELPTGGPTVQLGGRAAGRGAARAAEREERAASRRTPRRRTRRVLLAVAGAVVLISGVAAYQVAGSGGGSAPGAGSGAKSGSAVGGSVAGAVTGTHHELAPDLTGRSLAGSRAVLREHGLRVAGVGLGGCPGTSVAAHRVCAQVPKPGTVVDDGAGVQITLSTGPGAATG